MPPLDQLDVVVPVFNNHDTLEPLVQQVRAALDGTAVGFVFVDDASTDASRTVLKGLAAADPLVTVITNPRNMGQQNSIRIGLGQCMGKAVVVMDADLQDPPSAIPQMIEVLTGGSFDAVFATRVGRYQSGARTLTGRGFRRVMGWLTALPKGAGGFVIMRGLVATDLAAKQAKRFYLPGLIGCGGYRLGALPIQRANRSTGTSAYTGAMRWKTAYSNIAAVLHERVHHAKR